MELRDNLGDVYVDTYWPDFEICGAWIDEPSHKELVAVVCGYMISGERYYSARESSPYKVDTMIYSKGERGRRFRVTSERQRNWLIWNLRENFFFSEFDRPIVSSCACVEKRRTQGVVDIEPNDLKVALSKSGMTRIELARHLRVHPNLVHAWLAGRTPLSFKYRDVVLNMLDIGNEKDEETESDSLWRR